MTQLRDKNSSRAAFREATDQLASLLALEAAEWLPKKELAVQTPLAEASGKVFSQPLTLVPVLRSGLALLPPFLRFYPEARVGFIGLKRDEETMKVHNYYTRLPPVTGKERFFVLEPMIATGGSGVAALNILQEAGVSPQQILFISVIAAPEGLENIRVHYPDVTLLVAQLDQTLNSAKFIVPGLGDFGDRYFDQ